MGIISVSTTPQCEAKVGFFEYKVDISKSELPLGSMNLTSVFAELEAGRKTCFLFHGEEDYFLDEIARHVDSLIPPEHRDFNYHLLYGRDIEASQLVDAASRVPIGAPKQYVVLREAQSMRSLDKLIPYLERPNPTTVLYIFHKKKLDKRKKLYKAFESVAFIQESKTPYDNQIPSWIQEESRRRGLRLDANAVRTLNAYMGTNLKGLADAFEKLSLNTAQGDTITEDLVSSLIGINKDYNIFSLQSAVANRDRELSMRILQYYAGHTKETPLVLVINSLFGFFSQLCQLNQQGARSDGDVRRLTGVRHPGALRDYMNGLRHYNASQLTMCMHWIHEADLHSKGMGTRINDPSAVLKELVGKILL